MKKKVIAVNGSPRNNFNTAALLEKALEGAREKGAETELVNLYHLDFKGCVSCFGCKRKGVPVVRCVVKDGLAPVLARICEADALILGSPIYFAEVTGEMRSFLERFFFPYRSYDKTPSQFAKTIPTAFIYTMNAPSFALGLIGYNKKFRYYRRILEYVTGGPSIVLKSTETLQFDDYGKYAVTRFDGAKRVARHEKVFQADCRKAWELGQKLVGG